MELVLSHYSLYWSVRAKKTAKGHRAALTQESRDAATTAIHCRAGENIGSDCVDLPSLSRGAITLDSPKKRNNTITFYSATSSVVTQFAGKQSSCQRSLFRKRGGNDGYKDVPHDYIIDPYDTLEAVEESGSLRGAIADTV